MASLTYLQLLRSRPSFTRLWAGQVVSELGNWFNFIAGLGLVRAISHGAPEVTAALVVLRLAPFGLFSPLAGALVDRWSRRRVMIITDLARAVFALGFIFVREPQDLWMAYLCTACSALLAAFFEAARNAAMPNVAGDEGLLAGNALMFSSRFLLMTVGSALGGLASAHLGYQVAFVINAMSFAVSAYSIWLIPEDEMRARRAPWLSTSGNEVKDAGPTHSAQAPSFLSDLREGWSYTLRHSLVATLIGINMLWALGGGAVYLIFDRLGSAVFAAQIGWHPDTVVAIIYASAGAGLFFGMLMARRIGAKVELTEATPAFIGWMLIAHGVCFSVAGLMTSLPWACVMIFISRLIIGIEYAVQDTLLMRILPDNFRGRVYAIDRAGEIFMMSVTGLFAGWALHVIAPRTLTILSGLLAASPGIVWLALFSSGRVSMPRHPPPPVQNDSASTAESGIASAR